MMTGNFSATFQSLSISDYYQFPRILSAYIVQGKGFGKPKMPKSCLITPKKAKGAREGGKPQGPRRRPSAPPDHQEGVSRAGNVDTKIAFPSDLFGGSPARGSEKQLHGRTKKAGGPLLLDMTGVGIIVLSR